MWVHSIYNHIYDITIFISSLSLIICFLLNINYTANFFKNVNLDILRLTVLYSFLITFILIIIKVVIQFFFSTNLPNYFYELVIDSSTVINNLKIRNVGIMFNNLGAALLLLCYTTTIYSLVYLGDRDIFKRGSTFQFFLFFLICSTIMISTHNLLILFVSFELIFLPSVYYVYSLGYIKKVDKTTFFLLFWTLLGSFIILFTIGYIYSISGSLDFIFLLKNKFSEYEMNCIYFSLFLGFSIKLPIFPFHYWLTKVHVEAPAGFSMFLSGFLVKTAFYCFYIVNMIFQTVNLKYIYIVWLSICIVEASVKMWCQVDLKKLIAFATIQEMNMLLLLALLVQSTNNNVIIIFLLMHGLLSTLMFFLVDQVQKRAQTRNIPNLSGFGVQYPNLYTSIWWMLVFYFGLPVTSKFLVEWYLGTLLLTTSGIFGMFIFFISLVFGAIGFAKCWFSILYGIPSLSLLTIKSVDLTKLETKFIISLIISLIFLNFLLYFVL